MQIRLTKKISASWFMNKLSKCVILICKYGIFQMGDITFLIRKLSNLIHNLFKIHLRYTVEQCERFLRTDQVTT